LGVQGKMEEFVFSIRFDVRTTKRKTGSVKLD
jgi:hypothetical protein